MRHENDHDECRKGMVCMGEWVGSIICYKSANTVHVNYKQTKHFHRMTFPCKYTYLVVWGRQHNNRFTIWSLQGLTGCLCSSCHVNHPPTRMYLCLVVAQFHWSSCTVKAQQRARDKGLVESGEWLIWELRDGSILINLSISLKRIQRIKRCTEV